METKGDGFTLGTAPMSATFIYKLLTRAEWEAAQADGAYHGSAHDVRDGFIHFSTAAQLAGTARKYFVGVRDLVLLAVEVPALESYPSSRPSPAGGEGTVPHRRTSKPERGALDNALSPLAGEGRGEEANTLRWEPSREGDLFPHLYATLPIAAVKTATPIALDAAGIPIIPSDLRP